MGDWHVSPVLTIPAGHQVHQGDRVTLGASRDRGLPWECCISEAILFSYSFWGGFPDGVRTQVKNSPANVGDIRDKVFIPGHEDPLGKEMATHSSVLAWEIPWTEEPGGVHGVASRTQLKRLRTIAVLRI